MVVPEITVQSEDYAQARKTFHMLRIRRIARIQPPIGDAEVYFASGGLRLMAWINSPAREDQQEHSAVLFLHGGFCFDVSDWEEVKAFRDSGIS
jgi:hypothetical protein